MHLAVSCAQGEAGVVVPDDGYLAQAHKLLQQHRALLIADEVRYLLGWLLTSVVWTHRERSLMSWVCLIGRKEVFAAVTMR